MVEPHRWTVRVRGDNVDRCTAFARRIPLRIGPPISFDIECDHATALEYFLAAVAGDVLAGLQIRAKRRRVEIDNIESTVECTLNNPLAFLEVVGEEGNPGVRDLRLVAYISTLADESQIEQLWRDTLARSPMIQTLQHAVTLDMTYKIVL